MLDESEEKRVIAIRHVANRAVSNNHHCVEALRPDTIKWLADRLYELNDECSQVSQELYKLNREYALLSERCE